MLDRPEGAEPVGRLQRQWSSHDIGSGGLGGGDGTGVAGVAVCENQDEGTVAVAKPVYATSSVSPALPVACGAAAYAATRP